MKHNIKRVMLFVLAMLMIVSLCACQTNSGLDPYEAAGQNGVLFTDSFTGNVTDAKWTVNWVEHLSAPELVNDSLLMSGSGTEPCAIMLNEELPDQVDLYFTLDISKRGGDSRDPGVFFCIDGDYQQRYLLLFSEGRLLIRYNGTKDVAVKRIDDLTAGQVYAVHLALKGTGMEVYLNGEAEPAMSFKPSREFESFKDARYFGMVSYSKEAIFDNVVISNGSDFIAVEEMAIYGTDNATSIDGLGKSLQMQVDANPTNSTDRAFVWTVDNEQIASITQDGLLTSIGYGTVTVTAKARDGSQVSASCKIHIGLDKNAPTNPVISTNRPNVLAQSVNVVAGENPGVCVLEDGKILIFSENAGKGTVSVSADHGKTWSNLFTGDIVSGRLIETDGGICLLGADPATSDLIAYVSKDAGKTWTDKAILDTRNWSGKPSAPIYRNGYVYVTMDVESAEAVANGYSGNAALSPILMRAELTSDLTLTESWKFSSEMAYADIFKNGSAESVNFVDVPNSYGDPKTVGWSDGNLFQVYDETQVLYDAQMRTFYLYLQGGEGLEGAQGYGLLLKIKENSRGDMTPSLVTTPVDGKNFLFVPMPGGNEKFSLCYDEQTNLYWLASNYLNEDGRVALYFSLNAYDWCFAGFAAKMEQGTCGDPTITFCGNDLLVVMEQSDGANSQIVICTIENYAALVY